MRVGELARLSDMSTSTLRYYEKLGLLPRPSRTTSGYRDYPKETPGQLALIRRAKQLGFSLREIRALLTRPRGASREAVLAAVADKLTELERERIALRAKERQLRDLRARVLRDGAARGDVADLLLHWDRQDGAISLDRPSLGHFDEGGDRVLAVATSEAELLHHSWIGSEHLLLALAQLTDPGMRAIFGSAAYEIAALRRSVVKIVGAVTSNEAGVFITHRVQRIMGLAEGLALAEDRRATAADLLLAMLEDGGGVAVRLMRDRGADPAKVAAALREELG